MRLAPQLMPRWPKLAWVASFNAGSPQIAVLHGPMVEVAEDWIAEAVWAGNFSEGKFDETDLIVGSGIRCRGNNVFFVCSGTAVDRLWHWHENGQWHISNSLPALLAVAHASLRDDYRGYVDDVESIDENREKLNGYVRQFPVDRGELQVQFFHNLCFNGESVFEVQKPDTTPPLRSYAEYYNYLTQTATHIGSNACDAARQHSVVPVTTISKGYDSCAVAVIARHAGCTTALTITNATSFWRGSDSGELIAAKLGLPCSRYRHHQKVYRWEEAIWAAIGRPKGLNYTVFDYPEPVCLLFTGNYGDKIWDLSYPDVTEPSGDLSGLCLSELRLHRGIYHCVPAWWGVRHSLEIRAINESDEMLPWKLGNHYDRPIPRRIIEEAGIPRGCFAQRKMNTSSDSPFWWPYSRESQVSFARYLRDRQVVPPSRIAIMGLRALVYCENLVHGNITRRLGMSTRIRPKAGIDGRYYLFQWANHELKRHYSTSLPNGDIECLDKHTTALQSSP